MSQFFRIHPDNPQPRLINQAVQIIKDGGVVALPTDSSYALGCHLDDKDAVERLRRIRGIDDKQLLSLLVRDLSELSNFAMVDNQQYRLIKSVTPGPYVFVLQATKEVPRRLSHPSRKTIGLRVPDHAITLALLEALDADPAARHRAAQRRGGNSRAPGKAGRARDRCRCVSGGAVDGDRPFIGGASARARGERQSRTVRAHGVSAAQ
jgi:hypothetical protein